MSQSRTLSLVQTTTSVAGFGLSLVMQALLFPAVGLQATVSQSLKPALGFIGLSLLRSYVVRRLFHRIDGSRPPGGGSNSGGCARGPAGGGKYARGHDCDRGWIGMDVSKET